MEHRAPHRDPRVFHLPVRLNRWRQLYGNPLVYSQHIVIDQYFMQGVNFLHKLFLSLLLYMKDDLLVSGEETQVKLGSTYMKALQVPWGKVIEVTQNFGDLWGKVN